MSVCATVRWRLEDDSQVPRLVGFRWPANRIVLSKSWEQERYLPGTTSIVVGSGDAHSKRAACPILHNSRESPPPPSRTRLSLHASRPAPHGASRLVQAMCAWSVKTRRVPSRHCRDATVYGHTTCRDDMRTTLTPHKQRGEGEK